MISTVMSAHPSTLSFPAVTTPFREAGSSALDERFAWAPPKAADMVLDRWGAPAAGAAVLVGMAPWPAPDPLMRFDLPAPAALVAPAALPDVVIEPKHPVASPFAAPKLEDAAELVLARQAAAEAAAPAAPQRRASRLALAAVAATGTVLAAGAAFLTFF